MAAPSRTVPHPGRALVLLLVLIVAMLLGVLGGKLFTPSQWDQRFKVGLGLDLSSGTQVTLRAQTLTGKAPSTDEMNAAVGVIESRVNGTGNSGAQVQPQGANLLVVTVPGKGSQQTIELVSSTALLMFRQVLLYEPYGATNTPVPAASASPSVTPISRCSTRSAYGSSPVGSRLRITSLDPLRTAISGNPAAGYTTNEDPIVMKRSEASVSSSARIIAAGGIDWPNETVAVLTWPPQEPQHGASPVRSNSIRMSSIS